jgi:RNA polymerase sigma-70 factor, ECF subfamily
LPALPVSTYSVPTGLLDTLRAGEGSVREVEAVDEDVLLAQALIDGHKEAALTAWRRFSPLVYRTLRRMLGPGVDLQDLTQEVFLRFFGKVKELKKRESLRSFVMAIAIRRAQEEIKRRRVRRWFAPLLGDAMMRPATTEMDPEAREAIVHLYETIDRLNVRDRTIYILRFIEGLEQGEISQTMGISVSTVRRRLERLTKRVNSLMNSDPVLSQYLARRRGSGPPAEAPDPADTTETDLADETEAEADPGSESDKDD